MAKPASQSYAAKRFALDEHLKDKLQDLLNDEKRATGYFNQNKDKLQHQESEVQTESEPTSDDSDTAKPKKTAKVADVSQTNQENLFKPQVGKWICRLNSSFRINFDLCVMVFATWNCLAIPMELSFEPDVAD